MDKRAALRRTVLFGDLDAEALDELAGLAQKRDLDRGELLFLVGEPAAGLFVIVSGKIRAYRVNSQGREQTIHVESAGATLAEGPVFDNGSYPATAVAEEKTTVLFLAQANVKRFLMKHPQVALKALQLMAQRLRSHAELIDALALQQVGQRLARFLLSEAQDANARRTKDGVEVELAHSNDDLAKRMGSVREVISRTLSRLEAAGLISQIQATPRRVLLIPDEHALAQYAGDGGGN